MLNKAMLLGGDGYAWVDGKIKAQLTVGKDPGWDDTSYGYVGGYGSLVPNPGYGFIAANMHKGSGMSKDKYSFSASYPVKIFGKDYPASLPAVTGFGTPSYEIYARLSEHLGRTIVVYLTPP